MLPNVLDQASFLLGQKATRKEIQKKLKHLVTKIPLDNHLIWKLKSTMSPTVESKANPAEEQDEINASVGRNLP